MAISDLREQGIRILSGYVGCSIDQVQRSRTISSGRLRNALQRASGQLHQPGASFRTRVLSPALGWCNQARSSQVRFFSPAITSCCAALLLAQLARCQEPQRPALVTFYTHGSTLATSMPFSRHGLFYGAIFDNQERLFVFHDAKFPKNNRYLRLQFSPGMHNFAASLTRKLKGQEYIEIRLEAGKQYFFRTQTTSEGIAVIEFDEGHIDQVSCETAREELQAAKPLMIEKIKLISSLQPAPEQILPVCPKQDGAALGQPPQD